jgi:hypothetical protein
MKERVENKGDVKGNGRMISLRKSHLETSEMVVVVIPWRMGEQPLGMEGRDPLVEIEAGIDAELQHNLRGPELRLKLQTALFELLD